MKPKSAIVIILVLLAGALIAVVGLRILYPDSDMETGVQEPAEPSGENDSEADVPEEAGENDQATEQVSFDSLEFEAEVLQENLNIPWEIRYISDEDDWLITQRSGELISLNHGQVAVIDEVEHIGEGGLLGMALDPDFESNRFLYFYVTVEDGGLVNRILRYTYENQELSDRTLILDGIPGDSIHNGGRIAFGPDDLLYITTGDARDPDLSQQEDSLAGKILRIAPDGSIPDDNPFDGSPVYSIGHRNPQGISWHPDTGDLYASEHGPERMDEVNLILPGRNYGWPVVTCDEAPTDYEDPVTCYSEFTLAPSGTTFYQPDFIEGTHLLVAGLRGNQVRRIELDDDGSVITEEELFTEWGRIRAVHELDGDLYLVTSNHSGMGSPGPSDDRFIRLRVSRPE